MYISETDTGQEYQIYVYNKIKYNSYMVVLNGGTSKHVRSVAPRACLKFQEHARSVASRACLQFQEPLRRVASRACLKFQEPVRRVSVSAVPRTS